MLLAQIKSNYSSGADSSSDNEEAEKEKKSSKKTKKEDEKEEKDEGAVHLATYCPSNPLYHLSSTWKKPFFSSPFIPEDEDSEGSSSDGNVKKRGRRHKLLRHKLSLSEDESGEEKAAAKEKKKGGKKSRKKGWLFLSFYFRYCVLFFFTCNAINLFPWLFFFPIFCHQLAAMTQIRTSRKKNPKAKSLHSLRCSVSLSKTGNDERRGEEDLPQWGNSSDDVIYCGWIWMHLLLPFDLLFKICIFLCCRATQKKDEEKQRSYKQKKKRRRIKVQESSSSNEKVFKMQSTRSQSESVQKFASSLSPW